jgi:molecular chaperone GrpE
MTNKKTDEVSGPEPIETVDGEVEVLDGVNVEDVLSAGDAPGDAMDPVEAEFIKLNDDLLRAKADFQNLRKQSAKRERDAVTRARARVLEDLLPLLDSFEAAERHSDDVEGLRLLHKQLSHALQQQGLEEVPAAGQPFDPNLHEAVQMVEDPDVTEPTVKEVYRKGYRMGDMQLRPATVVVAGPVEIAEG